MKIAMMAVNPNLYSHKRLVEAAEQRGHTIEIVNTLRLVINIASHRPTIYRDGVPLEGFDAVIPRIGASATYFGTAAVQQFEQMDIFCANSASGIAWSRDKSGTRGVSGISRGICCWRWML